MPVIFIEKELNNNTNTIRDQKNINKSIDCDKVKNKTGVAKISQ